MLADTELKKKKEIDKIKAEWAKAQMDIMKAKVGVSDAQADISAREQSKMKLLSQCVKNGQQFKYNSPLSSENDVNMMFAKIQKLSREDQLMLMWKKSQVQENDLLWTSCRLCSLQAI